MVDEPLVPLLIVQNVAEVAIDVADDAVEHEHVLSLLVEVHEIGRDGVRIVAVFFDQGVLQPDLQRRLDVVYAPQGHGRDVVEP